MVSVHFYKADTFIGKLVKLLGKTTYVHCALQIDSKHIIETDFGGKVSMTHVNKVPHMILYFDMSDKEEGYMLTKFNSIVSSAYDNMAIGNILSDLFKQNPKKYTCVELVCEMLEQVGFRFENKNIKPDELFNYLSSCNKLIRCRGREVEIL